MNNLVDEIKLETQAMYVMQEERALQETVLGGRSQMALGPTRLKELFMII